MFNPEKQKGVTRAISWNFPTEEELKLTDELNQALHAAGLYESEEESRRREVVLGQLDKLVKDFVYKVSISRNLSESMARAAGGKIFTFGSYRLGVHGAGADIDTLCVVPIHVTREDFFTVMYDMLKERPEVKELTSVPDAYVPVINMEYMGIPIDLLFARLYKPMIPADLNLSDNNLLKNLNEKCILSINGSRVTDSILSLVPDVDTFRMALRCIKYWAKQRGVYSNVMGFFGGVVWAMLVARVCQLYPNACAGAIVARFFKIMKGWTWPHPVLLKEIDDGPLHTRVWNPKIYHGDKAHRMPVITPAYPSMCATHNVSESTQKVIMGEFAKAFEVVEQIMIRKAPWEKLFEKSRFFHQYKYYLQVVASSDSEEKQLKWAGMVESRLRHLVGRLEAVYDITIAHPYVKCFHRNITCTDPEEAERVKQGIFSAKSKPLNSTDAPSPQQQGETNNGGNASPTYTIYTSTMYIGLGVRPKPANYPGPRKLDIVTPTADFIRIVHSWPDYDEASMGIAVRNVKSSDLPDEVFEGEPRPTSLKRTKPRHLAKENSTTFPEGELQSQPHKKLRSKQGQVDEAQQEPSVTTLVNGGSPTATTTHSPTDVVANQEQPLEGSSPRSNPTETNGTMGDNTAPSTQSVNGTSPTNGHVGSSTTVEKSASTQPGTETTTSMPPPLPRGTTQLKSNLGVNALRQATPRHSSGIKLRLTKPLK
ncbi:polynucleotide adenylyltransferase [Dispira simplex]|nr:polynucleotide adenylyltransferase [Dispira simplex]